MLVLAAGLRPGAAQAQEGYTIRGQVVSANTGQALANAAVSLTGTQFTTRTGSDGRFVLAARTEPGAQTLRAVVIGYAEATRPITLGAAREVTLEPIALQPSVVELGELVVTGTGGVATRRRALGHTVTTVSGDQITDSPAMSIDAALAGRVPGAQVMSNSGIPGGAVSVRLRGTGSIIAGSEPLYIIDGVIVDNSSDDAGINFGSRSNPTNRLADLNPNDIERIEVLKGAAAAALYGSRANNGVIQIFTKKGRVGGLDISAETRAQLGQRTRSLGQNQFPQNAAGNPVQRFNNEDLIFRDAWSNETFVSISGGADRTRFYLSGGYSDQKGILLGSDRQNVTARLNLDQQLGSWLNLSAGANYITNHTDLVINGEQAFGGLLTAVVFTPTTVDLSARDPETGQFVNRGTSFPNPLEVVEDWRSPQEVSRFVGSFRARATPVEGASLEYTFGYDTYGQSTSLYVPRGTPADLDGGAQSVQRDLHLVNNDLVGSYLFDPSPSLQLTTTAGLNHTYSNTENLATSASDLTPFTELVRGAIQTASQNRFETATLGYFLQEQLAWNDRVYLTGAVRWDASSTFGPNERWQVFPKLSGSWVVSEEPFWQDNVPSVVSNLRLRGALGYAGNQPPVGSAYARYSLYTGVTNVNRLGLVNESTAGNPNLKPERQREWEAGVDAAFVDDRFGLSFTYYDRFVDDLLLFRPFAPSSGFTRVLDNVGQLSNRGIELQLTSTNVDRTAFGWNSTLNFSRNRNRVEKLSTGNFTDPGSYINYVAVGKPIGVFRTFDYARDESGQIRTDAAGLPIRADTVSIVGDPNPDFLASLGNEFRLGQRLRATVLLDGMFGHDLWNQTQRIMDNALRGNSRTVEAELRGEFPVGYANRKSTIAGAYIEDGSFVKLRELSLAYSVPGSVASGIGLGSIELQLAARNLYTWTDYSGYDPEINMFGSATVARGTDFAVYPNPRTISFGVRVNY